MSVEQQLQDKGFEVTDAFVGDDFRVLRIEGHGASLQIRDDNEEALQQLLDARDEMVLQATETGPETMLRLADEGRIQLDAEDRDRLENFVGSED